MKPVLARGGECFLRDIIPREFAIGDRFVDPTEVLINDPAGSQIEMADLGIAHLSFGQTDVGSARAQFAAGVTAVELVMKRRVREERGVAIFLALVFAAGVNAPAVTNNEHHRPGHTAHSGDDSPDRQALSGCGIDNPEIASLHRESEVAQSFARACLPAGFWRAGRCLLQALGGAKTL